MSLQLRHGAASQMGPKAENQDAWRIVTPESAQISSKGYLLALADGVSSCADGKLAAETTVRAVAADYYATPETWAVASALDRLLIAHNRWLQAQRRDEPLLTTLTALVLRGSRYTVAHIGDSRLYRLRQGELQQLTVDHVWDQPGMQHVLKRAVGLDEHLMVDYLEGELELADRYLLCSDGVWQPLGPQRIHELLRLHTDPQRAAQALTEAALAAGSNDNVTAVLVQVEQLPQRALDDDMAALASLPLPPRLKPGQTFEGLLIDSLIHESRASLLYRVHDEHNQTWLLKTLTAQLADDDLAQQGLLQEEWFLKRLTNHYFPDVHTPGQRQHLYYLVRFYPGETLRQRREAMGNLPVAEAALLGIRLGKALGALHRLNIVHRDIKPDNLHWGHDERLRILDFGVASCPGITDDRSGFQPGTPSYMAPELFADMPASPQSDLYAAGVSLYWLLTGHYPYGEIEPFQHPKFGDPTPASRYRPDLPLWLDNLLLKAVAREPKQRFETAEEWLLAFERADRAPLQAPRRSALLTREPLKVWQTVALSSLLLNLLLLLFLLAR